MRWNAPRCVYVHNRKLASYLARSLIAPFGFLAGALLVLAFASQAETAALAEVDAGPSYVERMVERHGCWSGPAPVDMVGEVPGHVVVTWPGAVAATYGGRHAVKVALEHVFGDGVRGMVVHGFCR